MVCWWEAPVRLAVLVFVHFKKVERVMIILCFDQTWFNLECYLSIPLYTDDMDLPGWYFTVGCLLGKLVMDLRMSSTVLW